MISQGLYQKVGERIERIDNNLERLKTNDNIAEIRNISLELQVLHEDIVNYLGILRSMFEFEGF